MYKAILFVACFPHLDVEAKRIQNPGEGVTEKTMLAYRIGSPVLRNANAADAAGIAKYIYDDPMEHIGQNREASFLHAFLVTWKNRPGENYGFDCKYMECNDNACRECHLPANTKSGSLCAFGTLDWPGGGRWFSFEEHKKCRDSFDINELPCFTYEKLGSVSLTGIEKVKEAKREEAGKAVQGLFGAAVANALNAHAVDQTELKKSLMQAAFERFQDFRQDPDEDEESLSGGWDEDED
mmetsp:Transcript_17110/g.27725  ORF Transcript_17110/g.27725 Transcript_17110/m.27725 type:complete len:239 (+) Transcript_17110:86-802(+)